MIGLWHKKSKLSFLFVTGIIVLCVSFLIVSCGKGPKRKAADTDKGPFAIDFSLAPEGKEANVISTNKKIPSMEGKELTIEVWVKNRTNDTNGAMLNGGIFGRKDTFGGGFTLYVKNNVPKFSITNNIPGVTSTSGVSSTEDHIVSSGVSLVREVWTHIAGVLTREDQSSGPEDCATAGKEEPHLAIYVDGELKNCASTGSKYADEPGTKVLDAGLANMPLEDPLEGSKRLDAAIDEVRFWTIARTQDQIEECMNTELSFEGGGNCVISSFLITYWRLNEGEGPDVRDFSGNGSNGSGEVGLDLWDGGWVDGVPTLIRAD